jgi:hypothetical protein
MDVIAVMHMPGLMPVVSAWLVMDVISMRNDLGGHIIIMAGVVIIAAVPVAPESASPLSAVRVPVMRGLSPIPSVVMKRPAGMGRHLEEQQSDRCHSRESENFHERPPFSIRLRREEIWLRVGPLPARGSNRISGFSQPV